MGKSNILALGHDLGRLCLLDRTMLSVSLVCTSPYMLKGLVMKRTEKGTLKEIQMTKIGLMSCSKINAI